MNIKWDICKDRGCRYYKDRQDGCECQVLLVESAISAIKKVEFNIWEKKCPCVLEHTVLEQEDVK